MLTIFNVSFYFVLTNILNKKDKSSFSSETMFDYKVSGVFGEKPFTVKTGKRSFFVNKKIFSFLLIKDRNIIH